jgi:CTP:molybdopterin cytidylyltransferase MocA
MGNSSQVAFRCCFNYLAVAAVVLAAGQSARLELPRWKHDTCPAFAAGHADKDVETRADRIQNGQEKNRLPVRQQACGADRVIEVQRAVQYLPFCVCSRVRL